MTNPRVVVVVSGDPSDLYFANRLARRLDALAVVVEHQQAAVAPLVRLRKWSGKLLRFWEVPNLLRERRIMAGHLRRSAEIDRKGFGDDGYRLDLPGSCRLIELHGKDAVNSPDCVALLRELRPDLLLLCGCSILKGEILSVPRLGALNLHGGLAQRYRGVWTTLWAVVNREPEYVGATVHFVSPGIDDGAIVFQGRPELEPDDNPESLYVKVVQLGVEMMAAAVERVARGDVERYPLEERGQLYLSSMVTPQVLEKAWRATEEGVVKEYLADRQRRDAAVLPLLRGLYTRKGA